MEGRGWRAQVERRAREGKEGMDVEMREHSPVLTSQSMPCVTTRPPSTLPPPTSIPFPLIDCSPHPVSPLSLRRTCLHCAASEGNVRICELLLSNQADVNAVDRWGGTPLRAAFRESYFHVALTLQSAGGRLNLADRAVGRQLRELARSGLSERLQLLLGCGYQVGGVGSD